MLFRQLFNRKPIIVLRVILFSFLILQVIFSSAQNDTIGKLTFSAYGDLYYSFDFSNPQNHEKADFIYNHKRHNEVNANLIVAKANYSDKNIRANFGLMAGNYAQYNLKSEPTWAQFVYEANIGVKLSSKHNLWIDAGIMPSHIGFESAISSDCWTLTRSILAESSPYYETGLKMSYTNRKENLQIGLLLLNGWQKVSKPDYIQKPSFGMQINYKPTDLLTLNYSNFIGTDKADSLKSLRTYHNFYAQFEPTKKIAFIAGFDIGTENHNPTDYSIWLSPVLILRYAVNHKVNVAFRGEYYKDKDQVIISTKTTNGFQVSGLSANFDYKINNHVQCRIEGKLYHSRDKIFQKNSNNNYAMTTNISIKL